MTEGQYVTTLTGKGVGDSTQGQKKQVRESEEKDLRGTGMGRSSQFGKVLTVTNDFLF